MKITIFIIILIVLLIRVLFLTIGHLMIVFHKETRDKVVKKLKEDIEKYIRQEHIIKFFNNMIWIYLFIVLLICAFNGNITIE